MTSGQGRGTRLMGFESRKGDRVIFLGVCYTHSMFVTPAYRICTPLLTLRCWEEADAPRQKQAIDESLEHLRPWMPWVAFQPETVAQKAERIRAWRQEFVERKNLYYGIFSPDETQVLGSCGMHLSDSPQMREIGYWVHVAHTRHGVASQAAAALTRVAFELGQLQAMEIRCDARNIASAAVPRKLGYQLFASELADSANAVNGRIETLVWLLTAAQYPHSPASAQPVRAYSEQGSLLLSDMQNC